jgi:hypothetical protein
MLSDYFVLVNVVLSIVKIVLRKSPTKYAGLGLFS